MLHAPLYTSGHAAVLRSLLDANGHTDNISNRDGGTPMMRAITGAADSSEPVGRFLDCKPSVYL
jgi:hypothetical protein